MADTGPENPDRDWRSAPLGIFPKSLFLARRGYLPAPCLSHGRDLLDSRPDGSPMSGASYGWDEGSLFHGT